DPQIDLCTPATPRLDRQTGSCTPATPRLDRQTRALAPVRHPPGQAERVATRRARTTAALRRRSRAGPPAPAIPATRGGAQPHSSAADHGTPQYPIDSPRTRAPISSAATIAVVATR